MGDSVTPSPRRNSRRAAVPFSITRKQIFPVSDRFDQSGVLKIPQTLLYAVAWAQVFRHRILTFLSVRFLVSGLDAAAARFARAGCRRSWRVSDDGGLQFFGGQAGIRCSVD